MRKISILVLSLVSILAVVSCQKDEIRVIKSDTPVAPAITNLTDGASVELLKADADVPVAYEWSMSDFGFAASVTYTLQLDKQGNDFANAQDLGTTNNMGTLTVLTSELNSKLLLLKTDPQDPAPLAVEYRVKATVAANVEPVYSVVIKQSVKPYITAILYPSLFMLGDGCTAGWNNNLALPMAGGGPGGIYTLTTTLTAGKFIKFITTLGQWAPMYGTDAAGTNTSGNLVYRPTETVTDPASIPTPAADGTYTVTANIIMLTYTISAK